VLFNLHVNKYLMNLYFSLIIIIIVIIIIIIICYVSSTNNNFAKFLRNYMYIYI